MLCRAFSRSFSLLSENYKGSNNINLFNYGISDKEGIFTFYESRNWLDRDDTPPAILSSLHQSHKNNFYGMHWVETECRFVTFKKFIRIAVKPLGSKDKIRTIAN